MKSSFIKKAVIATVIFAASALCAWGQSADVITEVLGSKKLTYGQVSYIAASSLGLIDDDADYEEAIRVLKANGYIHKNYSASSKTPIPLKQFAYICCKTWNIINSVNFNIHDNPYYALKQLRALKMVSESLTGKKIISGAEGMAIITKCIDYNEEDQRERAIRKSIEDEAKMHERYNK